MNYLEAFLEGIEPPSKDQDSYPRMSTKPSKPSSGPGFVGLVGSRSKESLKIEAAEAPFLGNPGDTCLGGLTKPTKPSAGLVGPRPTPWGTVGCSAPEAPPLERFGPPARWPALAAERWGPSIGDPTPGIVIDRPEHDRVRATWEAAARAADPEAHAERAAIQHEHMPYIHATIAGWSVVWREKWGRRANELAESGVPHPDDERQAYAEVRVAIEAGAEPPPIVTPPPAGPATPPPVRWRCTSRYCRDGTRWWASAWGVVNCRGCRPPSFLASVVAQGDVAAAPLVDPTRSHQAISDVAS